MTLRELQALFDRQLIALYEAKELASIWKWWICERLNFTPMQVVQSMEDVLTEQQILQLESDLVRFSKREPLQYILENTEFYSLKLKCSPSALIPRPETEELVHWILEENSDFLTHFLDIGTGTGCIPLAVKNQRPSWNVSALDCSEKALELARENALIHSLDCLWINFDLLKDGNFPMVHPITIISSNPPYIPWKEKEKMASQVKDFEPNIALFVSDDDPIIFYRKIIEFSLQYGAPNVKVYVEIHENLSKELVDLFQRNQFANIELRKDLQGKERMIRAQRLSLSCET